MPAGAVLSGIGIGAPNANYHTGRIERPVNLWKFRSGEPNPEEGRRFFSLCKEVGNSFPGIPVRITNDANAAALGEIAYGNAGGMRDFIMVTLGTGLGSGFVAGGRMIYGHDGMAGELGHVVVEPGGRQCGCGRRGCLETYVSATGAKRTAFELMARETVPSVLRDVPYDKFDARIITEAAQRVIRWRSRFSLYGGEAGKGPCECRSDHLVRSRVLLRRLGPSRGSCWNRRAVTWRRICCLFTGAT